MGLLLCIGRGCFFLGGRGGLVGRRDRTITWVLVEIWGGDGRGDWYPSCVELYGLFFGVCFYHLGSEACGARKEIRVWM